MKNLTATINADQTMTVTYQGESRTFETWAAADRFTASRVFSGKFKTGTKLWPLSVTLWNKSGNVVVDNGGFGNKGGVSSIVGWWNNESSNNTHHKGARQ